jgi:1-acyl-sn-glycerol-3-phosphate acyltransferase
MSEDLSSFARKEGSLFVGLLRGLNACYVRMFHELRVRTPCRLPRHGPAIVVSNHISALDPILIQAVSPRLIRWMMAREYYQQKSLKWMLDRVGIIPVDRSGRDMAATRAALAALRDGCVLGVFPEGKIETSRELLPFQNGIVLLATKSGAPIHPVYVEGSQRGKDMLPAYLSPQSVSLRFGPPLTLNRSWAKAQGVQNAIAQAHSAVNNLRTDELDCLKNQRDLRTLPAV